ncbi:MAG: ATPase [Dinoroseobacter sp.]|nr:ATPase [Dinoroseobacter sp.]
MAARPYETAAEWLEAPKKRVLLFGMSGLGKTHVSNMLRENGDWFHYSIDYRIGTRYMGEHIVDNFKREAMKNPFLRDLLMSDSIYIGSNINFSNLAPVSTYLGKPGGVDKGGMPFEEYRRRQALFRQAELSALMDTPHFIERAEALYSYPHFVCDTGGSICEWVDPENANDPVLSTLSQHLLMIWLKGDDAHTEELIRRFDRDPKPMAYQPEFLAEMWTKYMAETGASEAEIDPDAFIRWTYAQALAHRQPRYANMARNWGITVEADEISGLRDAQDFDALIASTLGKTA